MATLWAEFIPYIAPSVPGCPDASINLALAEASAEFCAMTHVWRTDITPVETEVGEPLYTLTASGVIEDVSRVALDNVELLRMQRSDAGFDITAETGTPTHYWLVDDTTVRLYPIPDAVQTLSASLVLKTARNATGVETFLFNAHFDSLVSGALARLMRIPNKDWTNPKLSQMHQQIFYTGISEARTRAHRGVVFRIEPSPI